MARVYGGKSADQRERERRERLIAVASRAFSERGFANTGIDVLCWRAEMSLRVFYRLFHAKEEVFAAVVSRCVDDAVTAVIRRLETADQEAYAQVEAAVVAYVEYVTGNRRIYRLLHEEMHHLRGREAWGDPLVMVLARTLKGRLDWPEIEVRLMAAALAGVTAALLGEWHRDDGVSADQVRETVLWLCSAIASSAELISEVGRLEPSEGPPFTG
ncbi:TetR/AcrR family transcriptional regulator [Nonomuraea angiospora]